MRFDVIAPFLSFDAIDRDEMNGLLTAWKHRMGPIQRPIYKRPIDFALRLHGAPVAVVAADTLIRDTCDLTRADAFELSRLCADPKHRALCSIAMRLWRQFAYPVIRDAWKAPWVISYQDNASQHGGNLYRYDGWLILGYSSSGNDPRARDATAKVRRKVIWGWNADAAAMRARSAPERPSWARAS